MFRFILNFVEWHPYPIPKSAPLRTRLRLQLFDRLLTIALTIITAIELGTFYLLMHFNANLIEMTIFAVFLTIALLSMFMEGVYPKMSAYVERRYPYTVGESK